METLKITLVQPDLIWEEVDKNLNLLEKIMGEIDSTDLIILPEMFTTGFSMNLKIWNENLNEKVIGWMKHIAGKFNAAVMGSTMFIENKTFFNRMLMVEESGIYQKYDKRHLFKLGTENKYFAKGDRRLIFEYNNWKIFPAICYDLRFPVWGRNDVDYDLLICVANWPAQRDEHWNALLKARAVENQAYVAGVNRLGTDDKGIEYLGNSSVYAYDGKLMELIKKDKYITTVKLDRDKMFEYRESLNFLLDRDDFQINC